MVSAEYVSGFLSYVTAATLPAVWQAATQTLDDHGQPLPAAGHQREDQRLGHLRSNADSHEVLARHWGDFMVAFARARLDHPPRIARDPEPGRLAVQGGLSVFGGRPTLTGFVGNLFQQVSGRGRKKETKEFDTAAEALAALNQQGGVRVFGFGEYHPGNTDYFSTHDITRSMEVPTSLEHFAAEMIPYLVRETGVTVFGLEYLLAEASGRGSPVQAFLRTGQFSSALLSDLYTTMDPLATMMALESIRRLVAQGYPLEVHGLLNDEISRDHQLYHRSGGAFGRACGEYLPMSIDTINENAVAVAERALSQGRKLALYTGAAHNTVRPKKAQRAYTYVPRLTDVLDSDREFAEIRLLVPEYVADIRDNADDLALAQEAPFRGVSLVQSGDRENVLVYPGSLPLSELPRIVLIFS